MSGHKKVKTVKFSSLCGSAPPVITTQPETTSVKELVDGAPEENTFIHTRSGAVKFRDPNVKDHHSATIVPLGGSYIGAFSLSPVNQAQNTVGWTFSISDSLLDSMQEGQTITQSYKIIIKDNHGGKDSIVVTVRIIGTNDAPEIQSFFDGEEQFFPYGSVTEDINVNGAGDLTATNTFTFDDVDLLDTHTTSVTKDSSTLLGPGGMLAAVIIDPATGAGDGTIEWTYSVDNSTVQYLDDGETATETFTIKVDDGHGGFDTQQVTVYINGINDAPEANADTNWVKEDTDVSAAGNVLLDLTHTGAPSGLFGDAQDTDADVEPLTVSEVNGNAANLGVAVDGQFGRLTLNSDGTYTYTLFTLLENASAYAIVQGLPADAVPLSDSFSYTATDGTATDTSTLTISVFGDDDPVTITGLTAKANGGDAIVDEDDLPAGSDPAPKDPLTQPGTFTISAPDGLGDLTVGGVAVITNGVFAATSFTTPLGNILAFTGFNLATGAVTYEYTLNAAETHPGAGGENALFEDFEIVLTDTHPVPSTATATLSIAIIDDIADAINDDAGVIAEDAPFTYNVLSNDVTGADTPVIVTGAQLSTGTGALSFLPNGDVTFDPAAGFAGLVSITYTIRDADGDEDTAILTLEVAPDSVPRIAVASNVLVDEDGLPGAVADAGRPGETDANELAINTGSVVVNFGNDVPSNLAAAFELVDTGALDGQLQTLAGINVEFALESGKLTGRPVGGGAPVATIELLSAVAGPALNEATYSYQVTLHTPVQHASNSVEDSVFLNGVTFQVTDADGTTGQAAFSVEVADDQPASVSNVPAGVVVDEDALSGGIEGGPGDAIAGTTASGTVATMFQSGADSPLSYQLLSDTSALPVLTSGGTVLTYAVSGGTLTALSGIVPVFTFALDPTTGAFTFTLLQKLDHAPGAGENDISIDFKTIVQATDADGDWVSAAGNIVVVIDDDTGTLSVAANGLIVAALDESAISSTPAALGVINIGNDPDVAGAGAISTVTTAGALVTITAAFGADGPALVNPVSYALAVTNPGSGLFVTDGATITLALESGVIVGRVASGPLIGQAAFAIGIVTSTGAVTVEQYLSFDHPINPDPDDTVALAAGSVAVNVTITDRDGDSVTQGVDVSGQIKFDDAGPSFTGTTQAQSVVVHDETGGLQNGGAGDAGGNDVSFASLPSAVKSQFSSLSPVADDPDVSSDTGGAIGYAQSTGAMLGGMTANFGADGSGSQGYALVLNGGDGTPSGLFTTEGLSINLFQVSPALIVGRYDGADTGSGVSASDPVAVAIAIDPATGLAYTAQYVSLDHPVEANAGNGFNSYDEFVAIGAGKISVAATITDGDGDTATASAGISGNIRFEDSGPTAGTVTASISEAAAVNSNIMLLLDVSGSMADPSGLTGLSRLDVLKASVTELLEQYDGIGNVAVRIVAFSTNAAPIGATWLSVADAKTAVGSLTANGSTNYDETLTDAITAFSSAGSLAGAQNVAYFISDGNPNQPAGSPGINATEQAAWETFLDANNIVSFGLGAGSGATTAALDPVAFNGVSGAQIPSIVVTDLSQLTATLVSTLTGGSTSGNLLTAGPGSFGADGGYVKAVATGGKTFTYSNLTDTITVSGAGAASHTFNAATNVLSITTAIGGLLILDLDDGAYTYAGPASVSANVSDQFTYTLTDNDNDQASSTLTVDILNGDRPPLVRDDFVVTNVSGSGASIIVPEYALVFNDTDPDGQSIGITAVGAPQSDLSGVTRAGGNVTFADNDSDGGTFTYTGSTTAPAITDTAQVTVNRAQAGESTLDGTGLDNILIGRSGSADTILGYEGDDVLIGDGGNDILNGGTGADLLVGGAGSDSFFFAAGNSGQTLAAIDTIRDYTKGADEIDYTSSLSIGGSSAPATATQASINGTTGVATFAAGSGTTLDDALLDIAGRFQAASTSAGEFALFQVNGAGDFYIYISDSSNGVTSNDVIAQLLGVTSISSLAFAAGDLTIL
ncbi:MAG: DUF5801 repeats-in-toxin domain-containing protein [Hyphomicrobium sp.]